MTIDIEKYIESLYEQTLQCTADDFEFNFFCPPNYDDPPSENLTKCQIFIEFIYRYLKCDLLALDTGYILPEYGINSLEEFTAILTVNPLDVDELATDTIEWFLWRFVLASSTDRLDQIAKDCHLVAYVDTVNFEDPRSRKFRSEIERVFTQNGVPWDLGHLLFPIPA